MDKRVFLTVSICVGIFLAWQNLYLKPMAEKARLSEDALKGALPAVQGTSSQEPDAVVKRHDGSSGEPYSGKASTLHEKRLVTLSDGPAFSVVLNSVGAVIEAVQFQSYRGKDLSGLGSLLGQKSHLEISTPVKDWAHLSSALFQIESQDLDKKQVTFRYEDDRALVRRTYRLLPGQHALEHSTDIKFKSAQHPSYLFVSLSAKKSISKEYSENERREILLNKVGGSNKWTIDRLTGVEEDLGGVNWIGLSSRYFLAAIVPGGDSKPQSQVRLTDDDQVVASAFYRVDSDTVHIPLRYFYGPKELDVLRSVSRGLEAAVDFGWFTIFAYPMLKALNWFYRYVHNFGIAIILLTVLVKLLTYPLTLKSVRSMKEMQRIQPQLAKLRERYQDDKEKLNKEMLQLMRANGYNPMSGCLPMFVQMPIFIALYNVLFGAIELYGQPFFGWIHDLSAKDPYYVTPGLLAIMMFVQQKMTPSTATDPAQQRMMTMMPLIFAVMMLWLPSGLTLYMLVNSVVSILQQLLITRKLAVASR